MKTAKSYFNEAASWFGAAAAVAEFSILHTINPVVDLSGGLKYSAICFMTGLAVSLGVDRLGKGIAASHSAPKAP